jgi:peroxiredoxin
LNARKYTLGARRYPRLATCGTIVWDGDIPKPIAINVDKKKADMDEFVKNHPVTFTIVRDASNKLVNEVKIPTMPSSFLLGRDGKVHSFHRGFKGAESKKKYAAEIESLLK